jgi:S1-C subfamily serine protease
VSFGTVPDFAFEGVGVRVGGLVDGSPAQKADIREGDVITAIDGKPVANLQAFSAMLGSFAPGQTVKATVVRAGKELTVPVTLVER